jgi:branched-chain amino acid aminotransferase
MSPPKLFWTSNALQIFRRSGTSSISFSFPAPIKPSCSRWYSLKTDDASIKHLPGLDSSKLSITKTTTPKNLVPPEELIFGRTFTGMLLLCPEKQTSG